MKVDELMRGDWVIRKGIPNEHMQIVGFNEFKNLVYMDFQGRGITENIDGIEPIPITTEFLKKNGYSYNEIRDGWELIPNNGYGICYSDNGTFEFCIGIFDGYRGDIIYHYITDIQYVHELQHLFKDCKLEKEIIL